MGKEDSWGLCSPPPPRPGAQPGTEQAQGKPCPLTLTEAHHMPDTMGLLTSQVPPDAGGGTATPTSQAVETGSRVTWRRPGHLLTGGCLLFNRTLPYLREWEPLHFRVS